MSSPKICTYKGIEYTPEETERLLEALSNDEVIERGGGWKTILGNMENYTPNDFIEVARKNAEISVIQSAENLWGAAASAVKLFCLQFGVDLKSHNARIFFVKFAKFTATAKNLFEFGEYNQFKEGWKVANSHFYEHDGITPAQIHKMIVAVTKFVNILKLDKWDPKHFENGFMTALSADPELKFTLENVNETKKFAGAQWKVKLRVGSKPAKSGPN